MSTEWIVLVCSTKYVITVIINKGVYIQVIRSTARRYFLGQQHGPTWKCIHPKNKPTNNARNHGNLTKRTSELHKRATIPRKYLNAVCSWGECRKSFNFCWTFKAFVEPKLAQQKIDFWGSATHKRCIRSRFSDKRPNRSHLLGAPKLRWPRASRSLNPSLCVRVWKNTWESTVCFALFAWFTLAALLAGIVKTATDKACRVQNTWSVGTGLCLNARTQM